MASEACPKLGEYMGYRPILKVIARKGVSGELQGADIDDSSAPVGRQDGPGYERRIVRPEERDDGGNSSGDAMRRKG